MGNPVLVASAILSFAVAMAPAISVRAEPVPSTLEQVVHANARIMHGGAIAGDSVPFPAFEHTEVSAADILNGQELYHVNPLVAPAPETTIAKAGGENRVHTASRQAGGTRIVQSPRAAAPNS
jgi:hypothetical protein